MPQVVSLDDMPSLDESDWPTVDDSSDESGKVTCPECGELFKSRGLTRHLRLTHGTGGAPTSKPASKGTAALADRWAEFQRGAALFVSFACPLCASALVEDAATDGKAIADFAMHRPKIRKQLEDMLTGMDVMVLVGALAGTARKMITHHSLGVRLGLAGTQQHAQSHGAAEKMMDFLGHMPADTRMELLNQVFAARQSATVNHTDSQPVQQTQQYEPTSEDVPGSPPGVDIPYTDQDRQQVAMAHTGSEFASTGL